MYNAIRSPVHNTKTAPNGLAQAGETETPQEEKQPMALFTLRERALAGSIVAGLMEAWTVLAMAQQKPTSPIFSWHLPVGRTGADAFRPVPERGPPLTSSPQDPLVPTG